MGIKRADFAGSWYPGTKRECTKTIEQYLKGIPESSKEYEGYGGIVPHAGWYFSGRTALFLRMYVKFHNRLSKMYLFTKKEGFLITFIV